MWTRVGFCTTMGQKLIKVPSKAMGLAILPLEDDCRRSMNEGLLISFVVLAKLVLVGDAFAQFSSNWSPLST